MKLSSLLVLAVSAAVLAGCSSTNTQAPTAAQTTPIVNTKAATAAAVSIAQAISIAEAKTGGVAVSLDVRGQGAIYEIETITKTHEHQVQIDARTGELLSSTKEYDVNVMPSVKLSLADAAKIAQGSGTLHDISLERELGRTYYEAKVMVEHPYEIHIDANSGQILQSRIDYDD